MSKNVIQNCNVKIKSSLRFFFNLCKTYLNSDEQIAKKARKFILVINEILIIQHNTEEERKCV